MVSLGTWQRDPYKHQSEQKVQRRPAAEESAVAAAAASGKELCCTPWTQSWCYQILHLSFRKFNLQKVSGWLIVPFSFLHHPHKIKNRNKGGDIDWRFLIPCDMRASVRVGGAEEINTVTILWS